MESAAKQAKKLAVSYARIHLGYPALFSNGNLRDSNPKAGSSVSSSSPLFPLLFAEVSNGVMLDGFGGNDFGSGQPLRALSYLVKLPVGAKSLVNHPWRIPKGVYLNGLVIEMTSILGPFFHVSALPDHTIFKSQPDVGQQCFSDASTRRAADMLSSFTTIKTLMNTSYNDLAEVLLCLLRNLETRDSVLDYLAEVINKNASRAHLQVDPISCASFGMFVNLSAVMLRLAEPFLDANLTKRDKIGPAYVFNSIRLDLRGLTALHATSEEVAEWIDKVNPVKTDGSGLNRDGESKKHPVREVPSMHFQTLSILSRTFREVKIHFYYGTHPPKS
ncbi:hypothetical protein V6N13_058603 [Hibiscus sabdariffa]